MDQEPKYVVRLFDGENIKIYGIDIDPRCLEFKRNNVEIFIGSQSDKYFLEEIKNKTQLV